MQVKNLCKKHYEKKKKERVCPLEKIRLNNITAAKIIERGTFLNNKKYPTEAFVPSYATSQSTLPTR